MKASTLPSLSVVAAPAAFAVLPVNALAASMALSVMGTLAILFADYRRDLRPLRVQARAIPLTAAGRPPEGLREAA